MWTIKRLFSFFSNTAQVARHGEIVPIAEKLLTKGDGTFFPYVFVDLPIGFTKVQQFLFVACPQMSREILHYNVNPNSPNSPVDRGWVSPIFKDDLGDTLFTADYPKHKELRECVSQYFRQNLELRFGQNLCDRTHQLIENWSNEDGRPINVSKALPLYTSQAIIDNFIGKIEKPLELHDAMGTILRNMERRFKLKKALPKHEVQNAQRVIREIASKATKREENQSFLLGVMANARDTKQQPLFSLEDIEAMARFLFLAGQETVASTLPAILYHCTEHYQQKIREEWNQTEQNLNSVEALISFSKKSKWVQAVINENLRLFPPAFALNRVTKYPISLAGVSIPKNCAVILFSLFFQRDAQHWGENAQKFDPERWFLDKQTRPFIPFGIGPNHCLGQPFARLEMGIFLTLMCLKNSWTALNSSYEYFPKFSLSSKEDVRILLKNNYAN